MSFQFYPRNKFLKWLLVFLLALGIVALAATWYLNVKFKPLIQEKFKSLALQATNGLYKVDFSDLHTNLILGKITLSNVKILPNDTVYQKLIRQKKAPNNLYYIRLKQVEIQNFQLYELLIHQKIIIDLLLFDKPEITLVNKHFEFNENRPPRPRQSPYHYISKWFKSLRVSTVDFRNARLKYVNNNLKLKDIDSLNHLNVKLTDWLIDSSSSEDTSRLYLLKDININFNNYSYATPDSMYHINVSNFDFTASSGKVNIKKFELMPRYSETDFLKVNGYASDRYFIQLHKISLFGLNLPAYLQKRDVIANKMDITDGKIEVFNDNSYAAHKSDKTGRFPHQLLQKLNVKLNIRKIKLTNINVSYAEFDRDSKQKGKITFQHTSGTVSNITNFDQLKQKSPIMEANLISYVMGQGKLIVDFKFNLGSPLGAFDYNGTLTKLDGRKLNQITKPLGMLRVNRGNIKKLTFTIKANQNFAKGNMVFRYKDLSIALLKKEDGKDLLVKQGFLSMLANALVIHADNPSDGGRFTLAPIYFERISTASFFNFIWKTLFQGIKYSIGVTPRKETEIDRQIKRFEKIKIGFKNLKKPKKTKR
jgi:hypothetical protein